MSLTVQSTEYANDTQATSDVIEVTAEQQHRAGSWALLGRLFRACPEPELMQQLVSLAQESEGGDDLSVAMSLLGLAAGNASPDAVDDEFHALFVGLGRGELVPFGSWYLTGFLMETPLSHLRDDLRRLGYERDTGVHEPEDHIAALSEVMSLMIANNVALETQLLFFTTHIAPWAKTFFDDVKNAKTSVFYRAVGSFGKAFVDFENEYLNMKV